MPFGAVEVIHGNTDSFGRFVPLPPAASSEPVDTEAASAPTALSPAAALHRAQAAWREHQEQLASLRDEITAAAEARREALSCEAWAKVREIDRQVETLRIRIEGAELRGHELGETFTDAQAEIGQAERETVRRELHEELHAAAYRLVAAVEKARVLEARLNSEARTPSAEFVNGWLINRWTEYHHRKVHAEAA